MRLAYFPVQDASIYSQFPRRNAGLDEILEVGKMNDGIDEARSLVQFDINAISASLVDGTIASTATFDLTLYLANATSLQYPQFVELKVLSQSWQEGTGYFYQELVQFLDGVTWTFARSGSAWALSGSATMSIGTSQSFGIPAGDLTFDVTSIVQGWVSGTYPNNGLLIKFPDADEANPVLVGEAMFFSKDTHTIFLPTLTAKWNDQTYNTGSLSPWPTSSMYVACSNLKNSYRQDEMVRVDLFVRERSPLKMFNTVFSNFTGLMYLPTSSYFSITDMLSGTTIIPFDNNSLVSTDQNSSFIKFKVQNMYPRRQYQVLIKVIHDGLEEIFDNNSIFSVR